MDNQKAIEYFYRQMELGYIKNDTQQETYELAIYALEKQLNDKWIPVSEKLPDVRQHESGEPIEFIAMIKGAKVPTTLNISSDGNWFDYMYEDYNGKHTFDVLAWKPLPEPYKD